LNEQKRAAVSEERAPVLTDRLKPLAKEKSSDSFASAPKLEAKKFDAAPPERDESDVKAESEVAGSDAAIAAREPVPTAPGALAMRADTAAEKAPAGSAGSSNSFGVAASSSSAGASARSAVGAPVKGPGSGFDAAPYNPPGYNAAVSVDGSAWKVGANGKIAHSVAAGAYVAQNSGVTTELVAAAAVSKDVCWVGGGAGTILRTVDGGTNWQKVAAPTDDDISGVAARDADNASITTVDGERFVTSDGGNRWHPQ
jgi:hypothetical protein